jgi:hypothetical protein
LYAAALEAAVIIVVDEKKKQKKGRNEKFPSSAPRSQRLKL